MFITRLITLVLLVPASAAHARSFAYVPLGPAGQVSVIDTGSDVVTGTITTGGRPSGAAVHPDGSRAYITDVASYPNPGRLFVVDTFTNTVTATVALGLGPGGVAVNPAGTRVYVAVSGFLIPGQARVSVIDTSTNSIVGTVPIAVFAGDVECTPDGASVYVTSYDSSSVYVIDTATNTVSATVPVGGSPSGVSVTPDGSRAYVSVAGGANKMAVIDTATNTVATTIGTGDNPTGVVVTPSFAYVNNADFDSPHTTVIDTATNSIVTTIPVGDTPTGIGILPSGAKAYVLNQTSDSVSVIDTATNTVLSTIGVLGSPFARGRFVGPDLVCGDGSVQPGEECDDGAANGTNNCCSATCALVDTDGDGVCNANDLCVSATGAKLVIARVGTPAADDKLTLKGEAVVPYPFSPALDPVTNGVRLRIDDADSTVLDVTIPAGAFDPGTKVGWKTNGAGNKWVYQNGSATPPSGIVKVLVLDRSKKAPGTLRFIAKGKNGSYPVDPAALPAKAVLSLQPMPVAGQCADWLFPGPPPAPACTVSSGGTLKCK